MNESLYPENWLAIARKIKEACDWRCSECGTQCRRPGEFNLGWQYTLTVAHYEGEYEASMVFVVALCIRCHFGTTRSILQTCAAILGCGAGLQVNLNFSQLEKTSISFMYRYQQFSLRECLVRVRGASVSSQN